MSEAIRRGAQLLCLGGIFALLCFTINNHMAALAGILGLELGACSVIVERSWKA